MRRTGQDFRSSAAIREFPAGVREQHGIPPLSGNLLIRQDLRVPSGDEPKRRGGNRESAEVADKADDGSE